MAKTEIDKDLIRELAALMEETGLGEIEIERDDDRMRLVRATAPAAVTTALHSLPATIRSTSWLMASAAATAFRVAGERAELSCSAKTSADMSNHLRFVAQLVDQLLDVFDFYAALSSRRLGDFHQR